ncbi:GPP34 family phosphoprotein [Kitasatospora sp. NPDC091335]|uniref:GPP34 family phosphoprotein n=1 Tax=Kitasatospora sp. NPDC091335 TaxID=3364085 RepID=UPI003811E4C9
MKSSDTRPLAEELLLLCADPAGGRLRIPSLTVSTAVAGAALAELLPAGAITVDERRITGHQPLGGHDEPGTAVLAGLERAGKGRPRTLDHALRELTHPHGRTTRHYLDRMVGQGVLTARSRCFPGLPHRRWTAVRPDARALIAGRIAATLARTGPSDTTVPSDTTGPSDTAVPSGTTDERDRQLAGLVGAARPERRLYPGSKGARTRQAVRQPARGLPVPRAVEREIARRRSQSGS